MSSTFEWNRLFPWYYWNKNHSVHNSQFFYERNTYEPWFPHHFKEHPNYCDRKPVGDKTAQKFESSSCEVNIFHVEDIIYTSQTNITIKINETKISFESMLTARLSFQVVAVFVFIIWGWFRSACIQVISILFIIYNQSAHQHNPTTHRYVKPGFSTSCS